MLLSETVAERLRRKKRPVSTAAYVGLQRVEDLKNQPEQEENRSDTQSK